jgi:hypothetical protein
MHLRLSGISKSESYLSLRESCDKGGVRIGKTPKKLDNICCPQCRETKADTLKQLRPIGEGDQELEKRLVREELT